MGAVDHQGVQIVRIASYGVARGADGTRSALRPWPGPTLPALAFAVTSRSLHAALTDEAYAMIARLQAMATAAQQNLRRPAE